MKAVIYAFKLRAPGMMQIISDIYERIFPAVTTGPNVLVQFDWSSSASLEGDGGREGGHPKSKNKVPKKQRKLSTPFFELTARTCQKFSFRQSPLYSAWSVFPTYCSPIGSLHASTWIENLFRGIGATRQNGIDLRVSAV